jgi:hypothetical protein
VVLGGPDWYRLFGAGEAMAVLADRGSLRPALITLAIAGVLAVWATYAFSGAGLLPALPWLKPVLIVIAAVYTLRGLVGFVLVFVAPAGNSPAFWLWSSVICLAIGVVHIVGLAQRWTAL